MLPGLRPQYPCCPIHEASWTDNKTEGSGRITVFALVWHDKSDKLKGFEKYALAYQTGSLNYK